MPQMVVPKSSRGQGGPNEAQKVSWSEKWATSQQKCKSSIKMLILLFVFEGPSPIHWYLQAKLLAHSVNVPGDASSKTARTQLVRFDSDQAVRLYLDPGTQESP